VSEHEEHELHDRLDARANAIAPEEDWDDLLARVARRGRRTTRALASALSVVVIAAAVGIVIAARGSEPAPKAKPVAAPRDRVDATNTPIPTFSNPPNGGFGGLAGSAPLVQNGGSGGSSYAVASTGWMVLAGRNIDMARVFTRTTANGNVIRAYRADVDPASEAQGPPWWTPAAYCYPNAYVQADVSNNDIAGVGNGTLYAEQPKGATVGGQFTVIGRNEKSPHLVVIAQGPASAATLRATFSDGSHDEMAPIGGFAVLVGPATGDLTKIKVTVDALDASGASVGSAVLSDQSWTSIARVNDSTCLPPTTLPAAGKDQPADPAAAQQAVTNTFNAAFTHGISDSTFDSYFDDSHGFDQVKQQLLNGTFKEQVKTAQMKLNGVVFLDPTTAAIQYEIDISNYGTPSFPNRFTEAHLVNGSWKLARAGWCNDVSLAGITCPS
jgi:hypothetical protein